MYIQYSISETNYNMQRSNQWLNEESLFISGLQVCPLNAKVGET